MVVTGSKKEKMVTARIGQARMAGSMLPNTAVASVKKPLRAAAFFRNATKILRVIIKLISNAKTPKRRNPHQGSIVK